MMVLEPRRRHTRSPPANEEEDTDDDKVWATFEESDEVAKGIEVTVKAGYIKKGTLGMHRLESGKWVFVRRFSPSELVELGAEGAG